MKCFFFSQSRKKGHVFTDKPWRDYQGKLCFPLQFFSHEHRRENRDQTLKMKRQKKSKCSTRPSACPSPDCESDFGLAQDVTKQLEPHVWIINNNDPDLWLVGLISTPSLSRWLRDVSHLLWTRSELRSCRWARRCSPLSQRWGTAAPSSAGSDTDRWARPRQTWGINQWDKLLTSLPFKQHEDDNFISTPPPECEAWKEKHTWWTNVVLKQELWRIWIMDSFQLTRVSAPLCKKKNQQRKYSNTWFDCSPKWPDEKTLTPNVRTVFSLRRTVLQELKLRIDFLGQSVSWFSSSITMGPEKSQASTTNTGWFMDEWKREAY